MDNINVYPVLATWKLSKKHGTAPIHLSVDINGKRAAFPSTKKKVRPEDWDAENKKVKDKAVNSALINGTIKKFKSEIEASLMTRQLAGKALNKATVKKQVKRGKTGADFYAFCLEQIELQKYAPSTKDTYKSEVTKLQQYRSSLSFGDMDFSFLQGYSYYMREELGNSENTMWKSFKFMNTMVNLAIKTGDFIEDSPFKEFDRGSYSQGIPEYLEWPQIEKLHKAVTKKKGLTEDLKLTGYYALISYYTGLRFGDAVRFKYDRDVIETANGRRVRLHAEKNGELVTVAFNKYIAEVVDYIKDKPLPTLTNQEFNRRLKLIGMFAEISKPLKTHMGRHSFAMRCAELGMSEETVQRLLGHRERSSTRIYFRVKDNRADKEMQAWEKPHK